MAFYSFDVIGTAMMWSGLHGGGTFDVARYEAFLLTYVDAYRGPHVCSPDVGFWMAMGWGFAWLSHNLRRLRRPDLTPEDVDKHQTAADKVIRRPAGFQRTPSGVVDLQLDLTAAPQF